MMKIETDRIVPLTEARYNLKKLARRGQRGEVFILSDRGKLVAALGPLRLIEKESKPGGFKETKENLHTRTLKLQERITREVRRKNPHFDSLKALREVRRES